MLSVTLQKNKKTYLDYNQWRKQQFIDYSPRDAATIMYLVPWLLCANDPSVPGFVRELDKPFKIFNIDNNRDIVDREPQYKKMFGVHQESFTVRHLPGASDIQGMYTIGSVGTMGQTLHSDCDIWICVDRRHFDDRRLRSLNQKLHRIKGWLDDRVRIPVYFFLMDIEDIRRCDFGAVNFEGSGSAQKNVLKEEFYRTSILICGKIPFWWVAFDPAGPVDYEDVLKSSRRGGFEEYDLIDLGDLELIESGEYFGAALWQLNKSLTHPLKSIIKMLLLKMFLEAPQDELLCRRFRAFVLDSAGDAAPPDPALFTMNEVLRYFAVHGRQDHFAFIRKCFYLCYDLQWMSRKQTRRDETAGLVLKRYGMERRDIFSLNEFSSWGLDRHSEFGGLMFEFVTDIYRDILRIERGLSRDIGPDDLTIIGRKIASSRQVKEGKVPILHLSSDIFNLPALTFGFEGGLWKVFAAHNPPLPVIADEDVVFCLAYAAWNGIFDPLQIRMQPNPTSVTVQEIIDLGRTMRDVFGVYDIARVHFGKFLNEEIVNKMLVVLSAEETRAQTGKVDICVMYKNNWEEIFVRRFPSVEKMHAFFTGDRRVSRRLEMVCTLRRHDKSYDKILGQMTDRIGRMMPPD